ncbi:MAG: alpha/beta hydrolase [Bacilli bacterium]|nr:alpha/beta hydrolase [Bacilli bacterium]
MKQKINNIEVNYVDYGNPNGKPVVLLHGWGQNIEMMKFIGDRFVNDFRIIILDLPGHGQSEKPTTVWSIYDFSECVHTLLETLKIKKPIMIGHSFGGKVTLAYASKYECEKIVLLASPFKKEIKKLSLKTKVLKSLKKVPGLNKFEEFAKKHMGSTDYRNADPLMRSILVAHVNLDITEDVKKIKCPSLIVWGTEDDDVPYERAEELETLIADSGVVTLEGGTHYAYLEFLERVISVLRNFL